MSAASVEVPSYAEMETAIKYGTIMGHAHNVTEDVKSLQLLEFVRNKDTYLHNAYCNNSK